MSTNEHEKENKKEEKGNYKAFSVKHKRKKKKKGNCKVFYITC